MTVSRLFAYVSLVLFVSTCQGAGGTSPGAQDAHARTAPAQPKYEEFIGPGDALPIGSINDVNGEIIDLSAPDQRKLVILFATWCKDSNRALQALNQSDLLNDDSIEVIAIAREETAETVIAWRDENGIRVPLAADPDRSIYRQFAAAGVPRLITVSTGNKVIKMNLAEVEDPLSLIEWQ